MLQPCRQVDDPRPEIQLAARWWWQVNPVLLLAHDWLLPLTLRNTTRVSPTVSESKFGLRLNIAGSQVAIEMKIKEILTWADVPRSF